jgi:hypothetical protein
MESLLTLILLGVLFSLGVPVAFALAGAGLAGIWLITGNHNTDVHPDGILFGLGRASSGPL